MSSQSTVLIVDNEPMGRTTLEGLLLSQGYQLFFASSGREALVRAAEIMPDLVLLDVMMPEMDGFEVCRRMRADRSLAEMPILLITALDDRDSRLRGIEAGADDFISKPFDRNELRMRIRTVLRLDRYRRLNAERTRFAWVVDQADDGYLVLDTNDLLMYANPQARRYLGIPVDAVLPFEEPFPLVIRRHYRCEPETAWRTWRDIAAPQQPLPRYLVRPESPTAQSCWLQVEILEQPMGQAADRLVRLRDVSTQMATQRDMWKFQSMIVHKLRTPMAGMISSVELLREFTADLSPEQIVELARIVDNNVQRLGTQIEDILKYVDAHSLVKPDTGFPLATLQAMAVDIGARMGLSTVAVACQTELTNSRLPLSRNAVEVLLWELLENAKKFHPQQAPTVEILVYQTQNQEVRIEVRDDGLTLAPEQLTQVWTPYYQGGKHFTGEVNGMGLGLSVVAALLWNVGGTYHIANCADGPGVVVELTVPVQSADA